MTGPAAAVAAAPLTYRQQPALKDVRTSEVVYIQNPQDFYCQLTEAIEPLDDLMLRLTTAYEGKRVYLGSFTPVSGV